MEQSAVSQGVKVPISGGPDCAKQDEQRSAHFHFKTTMNHATNDTDAIDNATAFIAENITIIVVDEVIRKNRPAYGWTASREGISFYFAWWYNKLTMWYYSKTVSFKDLPKGSSPRTSGSEIKSDAINTRRITTTNEPRYARRVPVVEFKESSNSASTSTGRSIRIRRVTLESEGLPAPESIHAVVDGGCDQTVLEKGVWVFHVYKTLVHVNGGLAGMKHAGYACAKTFPDANGNQANFCVVTMVIVLTTTFLFGGTTERWPWVF